MRWFFQPTVIVPHAHWEAYGLSLQLLCLMHTGKPTGVAASHCIITR